MIVEFKARPKPFATGEVNARKPPISSLADLKALVGVPAAEQAANEPSQPASQLHLMLPKPHRSIW